MLKKGFSLCVSAVLTLALLAWTSANAQATVGIENRQGTSIPLRDFHFIDEDGHAVRLDGYFHPTRPVLVSLVYFGCPGICTVLLNGMIDAIKPLNLEPGRDFEIVVVSIDPNETSHLAHEKKDSYLKMYGRPKTSNGWHFLTGKQSDILALSQKLGFQYERAADSGVYVHASALFVLSPEGVLSNTLKGVRFSRKRLREALLDAAGGRVGTFLDQWSAICYSYLPHRGWLDRPERWLLFLTGMWITFPIVLKRLRTRNTFMVRHEQGG